MPEKMSEELLEKELDMLDDDYEIEEETSDAGDSDKDGSNLSDDASDQDTKDDGDTVKAKEIPDDKKTEDKEDDSGETKSEEANGSDETGEDSESGGEEGGEEPEGLDETSRINTLLAEIDRLSGLVKPVEVVPKKIEEAPKTKTVVEESSDAEVEIDFVGDLDMDDVASDSSILNKILNKVMKQGIDVGKKFNQDYLGTSMPQVIADQVSRYSQNQSMIDQFYRDNVELVNVKQAVKACAMQVANDNPDKGLEDILKMAAENTRKTLGIKKTVSSNESSSNPTGAAFAAQKGGQRKPSKKLSKLQQELDEL